LDVARAVIGEVGVQAEAGAAWEERTQAVPPIAII
jgi:hypothetical protein